MPVTLTRPPHAVMAVVVVALALTGGCATNKAARNDLSAGYHSLEQKRYDQAIQQADAFLAKEPNGAGSAEALYLRGRAFEQKVAANPHEAKANLQSARSSYIEALNRHPASKLEWTIRTSLGNVAYFQDDYATALSQFQTALPRTENAETRAWTLYRMGLCQQRLGQFQQADQTFALVQQQHPGTMQAQRAKEHAGARSFFVQLVTFKTGASADKAIAALRREGVEPARVENEQGFQQIRVGPVQSYAQAISLKTRFADRYPDAIIVP